MHFDYTGHAVFEDVPETSKKVEDVDDLSLFRHVSAFVFYCAFWNSSYLKSGGYTEASM